MTKDQSAKPQWADIELEPRVVENLRALFKLQSTPPPAPPITIRPGEVLDHVLDLAFRGEPDVRVLETLVRRTVGKQTLEEVGTHFGLSRERARHFEATAWKLVRERVEEDWYRRLGPGGRFLVWVRVDPVSKCAWRPELTAREQFELLHIISGCTFGHAEKPAVFWLDGAVADAVAVLSSGFSAGGGMEDALKLLYSSQGGAADATDWKLQFGEVDALANELGWPASLAEVFLRASGRFLLTAGGYYADKKWNKENWVGVIIRAMSDLDYDQWHISQVGAALRAVTEESPLADKFSNWTGHHVSAMFGRMAEKGLIKHAGRDGYWFLTERSDGHDDNYTALIELLKANGAPLHGNEMVAALRQQRRLVRLGTVRQIMDSHPDVFRAFGSNVFGLHDEQYRADPEAEAWIHAALDQRDPIEVEDLRAAAKSAQLPFAGRIVGQAVLCSGVVVHAGRILRAQKDAVVQADSGRNVIETAAAQVSHPALAEPPRNAAAPFGGYSKSLGFPDPIGGPIIGIDRVLEQIVAADGPLMRRSVIQLYLAGCPHIHAVGSRVKDTLNSRLDRLRDAGVLVEEENDAAAGPEARVVRLVGTPAVVLRPLGERDLMDVPLRELAAALMANASGLDAGDQERAIREVMAYYGCKRLSSGRRTYLMSALGKVFEYSAASERPD